MDATATAESPTADPTPKLDKVFGEQVRLAYGHMRAGLLATLVNATLLAAVLWGDVPAVRLLPWCAGMAIATLGHFALLRAYLRAEPVADPAPWARRFITGAAVAGCMWGVAGAALYPARTEAEFVLIFVIAGMAAGSLSTLSVLPRAFPAFLLPSTLPLVAQLFAQGSVRAVMGVMAVVFVATLLSAARRAGASMVQALGLGFENADLIKALRESEARFRALAEALARSMDLAIVAEGVENGAQLAFLAAHGCEEFQGYLVSPPVPASSVVNFFPGAVVQAA